MPPKRSKAASSQPVSASQPIPQPQRPTRTSARKRRHSDGSNASDVPSESSGSVVLKTPAKRSKRGRPAASEAPEVIVEEDEERIEAEDAVPECDTQTDDQAAFGGEAEETIEVTQTIKSKHVHFGNEDDEDDGFEKSTAEHITPHPRAKMTVKRRTLSPNAGGTKRFRTSATRPSLPPNLTQDTDIDAAELIRDLRYKPLREVLDKKIREMEESKRQSSQHHEHVQGLDGVIDEVELDHDMMVLDSQQEIEYPQLPMAPATPILHSEHKVKAESSPTSSAERVSWDAERKKYKDAIIALKDEADKAVTHLRVLNIEVGAIGFGEDGASPEAVLQSIRESFAGVREFFDTELPETLPDHASNEEIVNILVANVQDFACRLRTMSKELHDERTRTADLGKQVQGLVGHLAEKEIENRRTSTRFSSLDKSHDDKGRTITELKQKLSTAEDERDAREEERDDEITRANGLEYDKEELQRTLDRLSESLKKYQNEEARLTELVTKLEKEHTATVVSMNKEREETVREQDNQLDEEIQKNAAADKKIKEDGNTINDLTTHIEDTEKQRDELQQQLEATKAELSMETEDRQTAEADLKLKEAEAKDLEERVGRLEVQLNDLQKQQENLRKLNVVERQQREAAEAELDDRAAEIEDIKNKLQTSGKEANELRLRLHNAQTENEKQVMELKEQMSERDERYQTDMAAEVKRREGADGLAQERAEEIADMQSKLEKTEQHMAKLLKEKDDRIAELEEVVEQKDVELQTLRNSLLAAETDRDAQKQQDQKRIKGLEDKIGALKRTIADREVTIDELKEEGDDIDKKQVEELAERDTKITELATQLDDLRATVKDLDNEKAGLEHRVEQEAEHLLQLQNEKMDEIEALRATIRDKQEKILRVEETARVADDSWQELLAARNEEIQELKEVRTENNQAIVGLTEQHADFKRRVSDYVRRTSDQLTILQNSVSNAADAADEQANGMKDEGDALLAKLGDLNVPNGHQQVALAQHKAVKKVKGRKRKNADSGIGMDDERNGEMMEV